MSAPSQPNAFADSDEDNASMEMSPLKSGDVASLDKSHELPTEDDDSENDDDEGEDEEPVASIVASGSLSDEEGKTEDSMGASSKASSTKSAEKPTPSSGGKRKAPTGEPSSAKKRQPAAKGLFVPFRTVKKIMQQDPDINIIQNDAAIMVTAATGLFLKEFTEKSLESCKKKGRNTIKYDDVAEVRANNKNYSFLDMLLP